MSRGTSCGVAEEGNRYLQILWSNFADANLDVIRDPLDKISCILVLYIQHLHVYFLCGHVALENRRRRQVTAVPRIGSTNHVLEDEHLLRDFRRRECAVLLGM